MRTAYKVLAYLIALEVVIQAAAISLGVFGLGKWVDEGGTFDKAALESESIDFTGVVGFMIHGMNGMMVIPLLALIFFIVSFFAKVPGGVKWAGIVLLAVVVQVLVGMFAHGMPYLGLVHGLNALLIFGMSVDAARRASVTRDAYSADTSERELV